MGLNRLNNIRYDVERELSRSKKQHPDWPKNLFEAYAIVAEECGEVAQAILDWKDRAGDEDKIVNEMIQVAAMALRFLENTYKDKS
jgi:NTP pyrophosphatase (non-canonical NTP hydrolase)